MVKTNIFNLAGELGYELLVEQEQIGVDEIETPDPDRPGSWNSSDSKVFRSDFHLVAYLGFPNYSALETMFQRFQPLLVPFEADFEQRFGIRNRHGKAFTISYQPLLDVLEWLPDDRIVIEGMSCPHTLPYSLYEEFMEDTDNHQCNIRYLYQLCILSTKVLLFDATAFEIWSPVLWLQPKGFKSFQFNSESYWRSICFIFGFYRYRKAGSLRVNTAIPKILWHSIQTETLTKRVRDPDIRKINHTLRSATGDDESRHDNERLAELSDAHGHTEKNEKHVEGSKQLMTTPKQPILNTYDSEANEDIADTTGIGSTGRCKSQDTFKRSQLGAYDSGLALESQSKPNFQASTSRWAQSDMTRQVKRKFISNRMKNTLLSSKGRERHENDRKRALERSQTDKAGPHREPRSLVFDHPGWARKVPQSPITGPVTFATIYERSRDADGMNRNSISDDLIQDDTLVKGLNDYPTSSAVDNKIPERFQTSIMSSTAKEYSHNLSDQFLTLEEWMEQLATNTSDEHREEYAILVHLFSHLSEDCAKRVAEGVRYYNACTRESLQQSSELLLAVLKIMLGAIHIGFLGFHTTDQYLMEASKAVKIACKRLANTILDIITQRADISKNYGIEALARLSIYYYETGAGKYPTSLHHIQQRLGKLEELQRACDAEQELVKGSVEDDCAFMKQVLEDELTRTQTLSNNPQYND